MFEDLYLHERLAVTVTLTLTVAEYGLGVRENVNSFNSIHSIRFVLHLPLGYCVFVIFHFAKYNFFFVFKIYAEFRSTILLASRLFD